MRTVALFLLTLLPFAASCAQPGVEHKPFVRLGTTAFDSIDFDYSILGYTDSGATDYSSLEFGVGAVAVKGGKPQSRAEFVIAESSFESSFGGVDALELSGGGRYFFSSSSGLLPFLGLYSVGTYFEEVLGVDPGIHVGVRPEAGLEYHFSDQFFLDVAVRYLVPLLGAEATVDGFSLGTTDFSGLSAMIGIGVEF